MYVVYGPVMGVCRLIQRRRAKLSGILTMPSHCEIQFCFFDTTRSWVWTWPIRTGPVSEWTCCAVRVYLVWTRLPALASSTRTMRTLEAPPFNVCLARPCPIGRVFGIAIGKVREFHIGQGKVRVIRKSRGNCGLPVIWYRSCNSHKINITWILLSRVDMHKMDCK